MTELFDGYHDNYRDVVQSSIDFSGLPHHFFMRAKADLLRDLIAERLDAERPEMLDVGCGVGSPSSPAARHGRPLERYRRVFGQPGAGSRRQPRGRLP
ncbi:2-polyprenyl-3-methyl-5-hydroxy-6-metoxy-1,4-benzoquinol methylase [Bradyrhizobium diazoefficiens]